MIMERSSIHKIIAGVKRYLGLQREYVMLTFAEKLTVLLASLIAGSIVALLALLALVFLSFAAESWIEQLTGSAPLAYLLVALFYVVFCVLVYLNRRRWIANPVADFLAAVLLDNGTEAGDDEKEKLS